MSVWVGTAPISIGHHLISSSRGRTHIDRPFPCHDSSVSGTAPISIRHHLINSSRGRTYIDRSFIISAQFLGPHLYRSVIILSVRVGAAPISIGHVPITFCVQFESGPRLYRSVIVLLDWVESCSISSHHLPSFWAFRVVLFTWLLSAYRLFIIALLDFPPSLHMTRSFEITTRIYVMLLGTLHLAFSCISHKESPLDTFFFLYFKVVRPLLIFDIDLRVTFGNILKGVWIHSAALEALWGLPFSLDF